MNITPVAYRYARSLFELANEQGALEGTQADMHLVERTCRKERDLRLLLKSPVIKPDKKSHVLEQVFAGRIGRITARFIALMVRKGREVMLPQVAAAFGELYDRQQGIIKGEVISAAPLGEGTRERIARLMESRNPGKTVTLTEKIDPALIGGVVVRVGDLQYDGSVARRLHDLRRKFRENPYIPKF